MRRRFGMTLMEVMIVVVVMGILAAVAIPSYQKAVEHGYRREAQDLLLTIYSGERSYYFAEKAYLGGLTSGSPQSEWRKIFVDNPKLGSVPVDFSVDSPTPDTFTSTATRSTGTVPRSMTINELREWCGGDSNPDNSNCQGSWPP